VKPQNVLIDEEGRAKVTDFGIALGLEPEGLTAAGRVVGTTDYVSPEQAMGHEVTGQSDVYSLGIVLFEMLSGNVPFRGDSSVSVAMKHVQEGIPDIQKRRPGVSAALAGVLERATAKELGNRYVSMDQFVKDLEEVLSYETARAGEATGEATAILSELPANVAHSRPSWRRLLPVAAYVLIAGLAAVAAVVLIGGNGDSKSSAEGDLSRIPLSESAVHDYDPPPGDTTENSDQRGLALDGDKTTAWETENYDTPDLGNIKDGVGLYLDAGRPVVAHGLRIVTPKAGWSFQIYVANEVPADVKGWTLVTSDTMDSTHKTVDLDTAGRSFRFYLIWITKLTQSPTGRSNAAISDLELLG
jgi:serine/threonine protein kinase